MNETEARDLIERAKAAMTLTAELIDEIWNQRAWEPLGYDSFAALWQAEFSEAALPATARVTAVCHLIEGGATDTDIARAVYGVGMEIAASVREQLEQETPFSRIMLQRRRRNQIPRRAYDRHIDIMVTEAEYEACAQLAGDGCTVVDWALHLIRDTIALAAENEV